MRARQTVFLVDDDAAVLRGFSRLLAAHGYRVEAFDSGREFIRLYDPQKAGCLVLDVQMPEVTGVEVQDWLSRMGSPLPVIFATGADPVTLPDGDRVVEILKKPVEGSDLVAAVGRALASRSLGA